jgi:hypothetical protein
MMGKYGGEETKAVLRSFVDIELICRNPAALDNSYISIRNSDFEQNDLTKVQIEENYIDSSVEENNSSRFSYNNYNKQPIQNAQVFKERILHQLNNMRFLFNDSGIKILTYPEVEFTKSLSGNGDKSGQVQQLDTKLFNYSKKITSKELFLNLF